MLWRLRELCQRGPKWSRKIAIPLYRVASLFWGSYIPIRDVFASRPVFPHGPLGVFIASDAAIGKDCVIYQHVTIGANTLPDARRFGSPTIGDRVFLGAGAMVIGNVVIGDNVRIGAGCVVTDDVPADSVVVSGPNRVISRLGMDNRHIVWREEDWQHYGPDGWASVSPKYLER